MILRKACKTKALADQKQGQRNVFTNKGHTMPGLSSISRLDCHLPQMFLIVVVAI